MDYFSELKQLVRIGITKMTIITIKEMLKY